MTQALYFIISAVANLVILVFLLRFWLPVLRIDFRNPFAQGLLRITSPIIIPVRRLLPPIGRIDTATVLVLLVLQAITVLILVLLRGFMPPPADIAAVVALELVVHSLYLFLFAIIIGVVLSWFAPQTYNPMVAMVHAVAEPVLRPFRKISPNLGGIDISPLFALILIQASVILLRSLQPFQV